MSENNKQETYFSAYGEPAKPGTVVTSSGRVIFRFEPWDPAAEAAADYEARALAAFEKFIANYEDEMREMRRRNQSG